MKSLTIIFITLLALIQYPLWFGKGSWFKVWNLNHQIEQQKKVNSDNQVRNNVLNAEVTDLKQGFSAIEERARNELGMIKQDEVFFQIRNQEQGKKDNEQTNSSSIKH
ncbi:MAG: cell division protein FtsB [Candidatus Methylopumilus sp.]|nr:cell division protein FtsB [Candidatus Methylopumilus sp.]